MSPGWSWLQLTRGNAVACEPEEWAMLTPAAPHAALVRPEQSNVFGPEVANTYGLPSCARAYATATAARDDGAGAGEEGGGVGDEEGGGVGDVGGGAGFGAADGPVPVRPELPELAAMARGVPTGPAPSPVGVRCAAA